MTMNCRTMKSRISPNSINLLKLRRRMICFLMISAFYITVIFGGKLIGTKEVEPQNNGAKLVGFSKGFLGRTLLEFTNESMISFNSTNINCTPPAINDFPQDLFTDEQRRHGATVLHAFFAVYLFTLISIVCDNYFVPSIKRITKVLHISKDVAGATFMAAATSSPELFINTVGTFVTEGDIGVGTIVGSGVFNILAVPACCGLVAGKSLQLDWWPLTRDTIAYSISVIILILTMSDDLVSWQEALILVASYIIYILFMCFNEKLEKRILGCKSSLSASETETDQLLPQESNKYHAFTSYKGQTFGWAENSMDDETESVESDDGEEVTASPWIWPASKRKICKAWWIFIWPIMTLLSITIPDCRQPSRKHLYPLTFIMCVLYIGSASFLVAWMITVIGDTARIPDSVMGLTFLAAGTSLPEAVSSVIVTNQGYGTMGLSNSIGSNTFDILLCLGFPWLIKSTLMPTVPGQHYVIINSKGFEYNAITLLSSLLILYVSFALNKFKLNRKIGLVCLFIYITFIIVASLNELNFFYMVNKPTCGW